MAESLVAVTPGAGKNLHTFNRTTSAGSVEDEVVLLGENYLPTYNVPFLGISVATANSHVLQIMAGATLKLRIRRIEIYQAAMATAVALMDLRLYRLTTAGTGGAATIPAALDPAELAAGASGMTLPTVKGTEGSLMFLASVEMQQTLAASAQFAEPCLVWDFDRPRSKPLIIAAGVANGIAIKNINAIAGATLTGNVWVDESSFA